MSIRVVRPGLLTTVQDLGRRGWQRFGVVVGGAMDSLAMRVANILVGNAEQDAGLEITLLGPMLEFQQDALIAICGADLSPCVEGTPVPGWRPVYMRRGAVLTFGEAVRGCRACLAVAGGIDVPVVMGSRSTYLRARLGGCGGRALQAGDILALRSPSDRSMAALSSLCERAGDGRPFVAVPWCAEVPQYQVPATVRLMPGDQFDWLAHDSQALMFTSAFAVTPNSDRMGYRLSGPPLQRTRVQELISEATCPGVVQLPRDGQPIVLMADCATTGGYAKVGQAALVDLPGLAQLKPGDSIRFQPVDIREAQRLYRAQEESLRRLRLGVAMKLHEVPR
jgi:antagonist of KipI